MVLAAADRPVEQILALGCVVRDDVGAETGPKKDDFGSFAARVPPADHSGQELAEKASGSLKL